MFEYIYYRLFHYYEKLYKSSKRNIIEWSVDDYLFSTNLTLSTWESMLVFCIAMTLRVLLPLESLFHNVFFELLLTLGACAAFIIYNKKHFKNKMPELNEKYKEARINKWLKTWLFVALFFSSMLFFMFFPFLFSNLMKLILT